jgi:hypothetical protein
LLQRIAGIAELTQSYQGSALAMNVWFWGDVVTNKPAAATLNLASIYSHSSKLISDDPQTLMIRSLCGSQVSLTASC